MTGARILIVEDETIVAFDLRRCLERMNYEVCGVFARGEDAIDEAEKEPPDLVLMDINLAGTLTGLEAAGAIRARAPIPIVFLSAFDDDQTIAAMRNAQMAGYVTKPFDEHELSRVLSATLSPE